MRIIILVLLFACAILSFQACTGKSAIQGSHISTTQNKLSGSGGSYTAASCNYSDVNAVINGPNHVAVNGDTINIPPNSGACTWSSGIVIPSGIGISIIGAGSGSTTITDNGVSSPIFYASPTYGNSVMRISSMTITAQTGTTPYSPIMIIGTCANGGCPNIRIDNIIFPTSWAVPSGKIQDGMLMIMDNVFGVIDHNSLNGTSSQPIGMTEVNYSAWQGVGQFGDNSWAQPDTFGTNQTLYLENNTLDNSYGTDTDSGGLYQNTGGGRFVCRFNTFTNVTGASACTNHGTETTGRPRGGRQMEAYNNTLTCTNGSQGCNSAFGSRSGAELIFDNSVTAEPGSWFNSYSSVGNFRTIAGFDPWGYCAGQGPWDSNDGVTYYTGTISSVSTGGEGLQITISGNPGWTTNQWTSNGAPYSIVDLSVNVTSGSWIGHPGYEVGSNTSNTISDNGAYAADYWNGPPKISPGDTIQILRSTICIDQPARGQSSYISGITPSPIGSVNNALDPIYEWGDIAKGSFNHEPLESGSNKLIKDRDLYYESLNQSAQTSPTSPFNGGSGTGHGTLANRPPTCTVGVAYWATDQGNWNQSGSGGQGELFLCTSTNSWVLHYIPFAYPHPLVSGAPGPTPTPISGPTTTIMSPVSGGLVP